MQYEGLKKLVGKSVNIWPAVLVLPEMRTTEMQWIVEEVDARTRVVKIVAPSGHTKNVADVVNHYQSAGNYLVLDAQLIIHGNELKVEPRPWGQAKKTLHQLMADGALRTRTRRRRRRATDGTTISLFSSER